MNLVEIPPDTAGELAMLWLLTPNAYVWCAVCMMHADHNTPAHGQPRPPA